jgi:archaetidylinositol phosphate synthase
LVSGRLKRQSDRMLKPVAMRLARSGLTPNMLTAIGLGLTLAAAYFLYLGDMIAGSILIFLGACADVMDGLVARYAKRATTGGAFLDSISDRFSDCAIFCAVILGGHINDFLWFSGLFWGLAALSGALLTSYVRQLSESKGVPMMGRGFVERPERLVIFCVSGVLGFLTYGIVALAILGYMTVLQRIYYFYKTNKNI